MFWQCKFIASSKKFKTSQSYSKQIVGIVDVRFYTNLCLLYVPEHAKVSKVRPLVYKVLLNHITIHRKERNREYTGTISHIHTALFFKVNLMSKSLNNFRHGKSYKLCVNVHAYLTCHPVLQILHQRSQATMLHV